ncbi:MAG: GNAT family N-acetyltransferase [Deltaproteobacteria bacterium]|nr:GNAT family N-acetyltransferase [Deltaproteobacteria bacterium]MBW2394172.1 GNAT family N-acetyltransferase [Deltaproteobacteria bacterium]
MEIREESLAHLEAHARIEIAFEVTRVFDLRVRDQGLGGFDLIERSVLPAYPKNYDAAPGSHPTEWGSRFDLTHWGLVSAWEGEQRLGGAVIAFDTKGLQMLEGRRDLAVLWDLRVAREARRQGVGASLFAAACEWAAARRCSQLKVETQNVNVPACRFYARQGCALHGIHRFAYPDLPEEVQLLWYKSLVDRPEVPTRK